MKNYEEKTRICNKEEMRKSRTEVKRGKSRGKGRQTMNN